MDPRFPIENAAEKTILPAEPLYTPYGYVIQPDGTTYSLLTQWTHGFILALLYPDVADEYNKTAERPLEYPDSLSEVSVFSFQNFELECAKRLNCVRVCPTRMMGPPSVDLPEAGCTDAQADALRNILFKVLGYEPTDEISMDHCDMPLTKMMRICKEPAESRFSSAWSAEEE